MNESVGVNSLVMLVASAFDDTAKASEAFRRNAKNVFFMGWI
jgi:hypothetical protein